MMELMEYEAQQVDAANASDRKPIVFVHGLWLLPSSWDRWAEYFEASGFVAVTAGWPDDPNSVDDANRHPDVFARKSVQQVADHVEDVIRSLRQRPAVIGHSFGGLLTEILAGRGCSDVSVAISPAPHRGVLPLPISALRSSSPVLRNPLNHGRAVPLTYDQFRYAFANRVTEDEAHELYNTFAVPAAGLPLFQAATANLNPWTEVKVKTKNADRGPLLIIGGAEDHTVPWSICNASYKREVRNRDAATEIVKLKDRGHSLTIDHGWKKVAKTALEFVQRYVKP
jgi:pimeloyl-ACP methyl ester carboxylesterase